MPCFRISSLLRGMTWIGTEECFSMEYFATCAGGRRRRKREKNVSIAPSRRRRRRQKIIIRNDHPKERHTHLSTSRVLRPKIIILSSNTHAQYTIRDATKTDDVVLRILLLLLLHRVARTSNVMSSWESYPMYTLKGISFVANASLFDISIIFFVVARVFLCRKKQKKTKKEMDDGVQK